MIDLIATRPLRYNRRDLVPGEPFQAASDRQARILVKSGRAQLPHAPASGSAEISRSAASADPDPNETPRPRGRRRRKADAGQP